MIISKIKTLTIAVILLVVPFILKAQPVEYRSNQGALIGTSDSRMFVTIQEAADHVEFKVSLLGELTARSIDFILLYDTNKLRLTDETYLYDIPDGFDASDFKSPVVAIPPSFSSRYPDHFTTPRRHRAIFSGDGVGMKYFVSELINVIPTSSPIYLLPGEVIHAYSIYCRKIKPDTPLTDSDFGYYAQIQQALPEPMPVQAPYWTFDACQIRYASGMSSAQAYIKPELFTYRSPSYVITENAENVQPTSAVLKAIFTRGDLIPKNNIMVSSYWAATYYGLLNWDSIVHCGFIYSNTDATILVNGYSNKLNINGTDYDFPDAAELETGIFIRNGITLYIKQQNNNSSDKEVSFLQNVSNLEIEENYYVWSFIHYTFETSDPLLYVGNKITFDTDSKNIYPPVVETPLRLCKSGISKLTLASVKVIIGENLKWYSTDTSEEVLPLSTVLENDKTYWVSQTIDGYESPRSYITVKLDAEMKIPAPELISPQEFCAQNVFTIDDLITNGYNLVWYLDAEGGDPLEKNLPLINGNTYYASQIIGNCESEIRTPVFVEFNDVIKITVSIDPQFFCEEALLSNIITPYNLIWYDSENSTEPLHYNTLLETRNYYAAVKMGECESSQRTEVSVTIGAPPLVITKKEQEFCTNATLADIYVVGYGVNWYDAEDATIPLPLYTKLENKATYYAANSNGFCEGARTGITVSLDSYPDVYTENLIYCSGENVPEYSFTGTQNTTFHWERVMGYDFGLSATNGVNSIPAFVAQNYGFEHVSAWYKVTPINEYGCVGESQQFLITVNPNPTTSPVEDMVYCNSVTAPRFDFSSNMPNVFFEWEFVNEVGSVMIEGIPTSGENFIPGFLTYNTGNKPKVGKYRVRAGYSFDNLTCYDEVWQYFNIVILPTPAILSVTPVLQTICSGEETAPVTFSSSVEEVVYKWSFNAGDLLPDFPMEGEGDVPSYIITNQQLFSLSTTYNVTAVLNYEAYPAYTCESSKATFSIVVSPVPHIDAVPDFVYCNGETAPVYLFTGNNALATYYWEFVSGADFGIASNGNNSFPSFIATNHDYVPLVGFYRVRATFSDFCPETEWFTFSVTVLPTPNVAVTPADQAINSGETMSDILFSGNVADVLYKWNRTEGNISAIPASGEGNIAGMVLYNTTLLPISATYSVVAVLNSEDYPGYTCTGAPAQFTITVNPVAASDTVPNFVYCNGETVPVYSFTGSNTLATYTWEFVSGDDLGIPATGNNSFPSFIAVNSGNAPITAIYRVKAVYNDYSSEWIEFTVTVLPTPAILSVTPVLQTICSGEETAPVTFSSSVEEVNYQWNRLYGNISTLPFSGTGNFESYTIINTGSTMMEAVYEVKPILNYPQYPQYICPGSSTQFSITVMPQPYINTPPAMVYCNGEQTQGFEFGNSSGLFYSWKLINGVHVGLAENGTGQLPGFIAVNNSNSEILEAIYEVTATVNMNGHECTHSVTFSIVVNPTPSLDVNITPYYFCANAETPVIDLTELFASLNNNEETVYEWYYDSDNYIGLDIESGTDIIPSFMTKNSSNQQLAGTFRVIAKFGKCTSVEKTFKMIVNPALNVISQTNAGSICSGTQFEYVIIPNIAVDEISWVRISNPHINNGEGANGNNDFIEEILSNTSASDITVTYFITLKTGECEYENIGKVEVVVNPSIEFSIDPITTVCHYESFITIEYDINVSEVHYTLLFGQEGNAAGFTSVLDFIPLPDNGIMLIMPKSELVGNYSATLTLKYGKCMKSYDIIIAVMGDPVATDMSNSELMFCENDDLYLFVTVENDVQYQWYFNGNILSGETESYYETTFDITKEGEYYVEVSNECSTVTYYFNVGQSPVMIKMKWDDVMYVPNNENKYVSYQWYKNGQPIALNGTNQYYSETGGFTPHAEYNVKAYKADGTYDEACPIIPNDGSASTGYSLTIYPNPTHPGNPITFILKLPDGEWTDADAFIYDITGKVVTQFKITGFSTQVTLNAAAGTYPVRVVTAAGNELIEKIIIK